MWHAPGGQILTSGDSILSLPQSSFLFLILYRHLLNTKQNNIYSLPMCTKYSTSKYQATLIAFLEQVLPGLLCHSLEKTLYFLRTSLSIVIQTRYNDTFIRICLVFLKSLYLIHTASSIYPLIFLRRM